MLGFVASVAFYSLDSLPGLNWRLMLASTSIPPIFVCIMTYFAPESPRWYMDKGKYRNAYQSLIKLRQTRLQAARDLYDIHIRLMLEHEVKPKSAWKRATALFSVSRNRRAAQSSFFVMFMQQVRNPFRLLVLIQPSNMSEHSTNHVIVLRSQRNCLLQLSNLY
jgi:hypothetical protein